MRGMTSEEIRALSDEGLIDAIEDKREELFNLRFQKEAGQMEDTNGLRYAKRDLARLLTIQRERQLAAQIAQGGKS
ncbi:MAG: 50S ribosomal protein L29 [Anaerolineae bacterium]